MATTGGPVGHMTYPLLHFVQHVLGTVQSVLSEKPVAMHCHLAPLSLQCKMSRLSHQRAAESKAVKPGTSAKVP